MSRVTAFCLAGALALAPLLTSGCAMSGAANASAQGAHATTGNAETHTVLSLSLGDAVAKAAADLARSVISGASGPVTEETRKSAIQQGVDKGLETAQKEGKTPTPEQKSELETLVGKVVDEAAQQAK